MRHTAVVIMAKAPQMGQVKTRLCPPLSLAEAAQLYRCFLLDTIANIQTLEAVSPVIAYAPTSSRTLFEDLTPDFTLIPQQGTDLGTRMATCFAQLFAEGYREILLTGSDLPTLPTAYLRQAIDLIMTPQNDVVLGPSEDGGYYLIGLRQLYRQLFAEIHWSTDQVLRETLRRAEVKQLRVACLPPWFDVDTTADLERLQTRLAEMQDSAPWHTRQFFLQHTS
jgi:rSAM/selenodomain-associated transferase 1